MVRKHCKLQISNCKSNHVNPRPRASETPSDFIALASGFGITVRPETLTSFATYERELLAWNQRMNLIAKGDEPNIWIRHFLDSLIGWSYALSLIPYPKSPLTPLFQRGESSSSLAPVVIDIGTGAGFPGIPIKLVWPGIKLTLVESVRKKTLFLKHLAEALSLKDVTVICARAEALGKEPEHRGHYDFALARAVGSLEELRKLSFPLLKGGGSLIAWRGDESTSHPGARSYCLPGETHQRNILILTKEESTYGS